MIDIEKIANLANLEIDKEEKMQLEKQLPQILEFVDAIKNAPVEKNLADENLAPNILRNDEPRDFPDKDLLKKDYQSPAVFS